MRICILFCVCGLPRAKTLINILLAHPCLIHSVHVYQKLFPHSLRIFEDNNNIPYTCTYVYPVHLYRTYTIAHMSLHNFTDIEIFGRDVQHYNISNSCTLKL